MIGEKSKILRISMALWYSIDLKIRAESILKNDIGKWQCNVQERRMKLLSKADRKDL
jgi:hypothetical protein